MRISSFLFLVLAHVTLLCLSNILVQHPVLVFSLHTTWGAFTYPLIFILTDLTTRLAGSVWARKVVYISMLPGLVVSFLISNWSEFGVLWVQNELALRIAVASFCAYVAGQLIDIVFFQALRQQAKWWVAPTVGTIFGNIFDTYCFFFIAFYHSTNPFLSMHWLEIASVDLAFKLLISLVSFVPLYGLMLTWLLQSKNTPVLIR